MINERNRPLPQKQTIVAEPITRRKERLGWWYRLSAPAEDESTPPQEAIPRSHLASILILISLVASIAFIPAAVTSDDLHVVPPVIGLFIVGCLCIPLNKRGHVTIVGIVIVGSLDAALIDSLLSYPRFTLTQNAIPIYDLFVLSDIIAISLLPMRSIFYVSAYHSVFMLADIVLQPHTPDLQVLLTSTSYSLMIRPLTIQIVVAIVTYLWVRNTLQALKRANQAEVIAQLEHTLAQRQQDLDEGIQEILATLIQAANGNTGVRAPLARQSVLWQVGVGLNTLLARLQRASQTERELHYTKAEIRRLLLYIHQTKGQQAPLWLSSGGTELDLLISEIQGLVLVQPPGPGKKIVG